MEFFVANVPEYTPNEPTNTSLGFATSINRLAEIPLDLNHFLIQNPDSTFFMKIQGESMTDYRLYDGDILIVDRSLSVKSNSLILAILNGEYVIKKIIFDENISPLHVTLLSNTDSYPDIQITPKDNLEIWGTIIYTIHKHV